MRVLRQEMGADFSTGRPRDKGQYFEARRGQIKTRHKESRVFYYAEGGETM